MDIHLGRRAALAAMGGAAVAGMAPHNLAAVETLGGGRLGFAMRDTATGRITAHRPDERFALCSTFKLPLAGLVLRAIDRGVLKADGRIAIARADLVPHAPVAGQAVGGSLTVRELARAAQVTSDNVAANLLMRALGGPAAVTAGLRALGDKVTRVDRWEPELNRVVAPDLRDTSTPRAMAATVERLLLGDGLSPESRALLAGWMVETRTGLNRLRAGVPRGWTVGDKTGTSYAPGEPNRTNDLAVVWPPGRAPLVVAAFHEAPGHFPGVRPQDEQLLADAMLVALGPLSDV